MTKKKSSVISFEGFSFQYRAQKKPTLTGINLNIYPGEKVVVIGPSGSGKDALTKKLCQEDRFVNPKTYCTKKSSKHHYLTKEQNGEVCPQRYHF